MNEQPNISFPALGVVKGDSMSLWMGMDTELGCNLLAYHNRYWHKLKLFDSASQVWSVKEVTPTRKLSWLEQYRFVANLFWNPKIKVHLTFAKPKSFDLAELKKSICHLINIDDDVMTQFIEADELKALVNSATSFNDLLDVLIKRKVVREKE